MNKLTAVASIATIVAAIYTIAAFYKTVPSETDNRQELVSDLPKTANDEFPENVNANQTSDGGNSLVSQPSKELMSLHEFASEISYSSTRNSELKNVLNVALEKGHLEYAILIAKDISKSSTRNAAFEEISIKYLENNDVQSATAVAELINYSSSRDKMLQKIMMQASE